MDRSLDEILAESRDERKGGKHRGAQRRRDYRNDLPRDGVRKPHRDDGPRNLDSEWVHDRFEDNGRRPHQSRKPRERESPEALSDLNGTKLRVENIHYELSREDLEGLFNCIGTVTKLDINYDRAGRPTGTAFVTYESYHDAREAIREFDGANANGQPIRLFTVPSRRQRRAFDTTAAIGRPLAERVTLPPERNRSASPSSRDWEHEAARKGIDRYVPGGRNNRSRSPVRGPRREVGRRPGARRGGGAREGGERSRRNSRPKKTQEELNAEMEDYFGGGGDAQSTANATTNGQAAMAPVAEDDLDMID